MPRVLLESIGISRLCIPCECLDCSISHHGTGERLTYLWRKNGQSIFLSGVSDAGAEEINMISWWYLQCKTLNYNLSMTRDGTLRRLIK
jgi:hypothetical protein